MGTNSKEQFLIQFLCIFSAYMHQKRREWEKKQKKFKNVANFNVPVLFASSEGLYLRLIDDEFGPSTEQNNDIENAVSQISILFLFLFNVYTRTVEALKKLGSPS